MKTKLKNSLLKVLSFVFAISAFALVGNLQYDTAKADGESVAVFAVDNTSSARIGNDGYYGIKFTATVNEKWVADQDAEKIEYGILVYEKANAIEIGEKSLEEVVAETSAVQYTYLNAKVEGEYTFGGTAVTNATETDELNAFLATEYEAKAYAIVDGELVWAEGSYASSARKTAALSVVADLENESIYNKYYSLLGEVDTVVAKADGKLFDLAVEDGAYTFIAPDKSVLPVSVKDGKLAVDTASLEAIATGETIEGFLFADGNDSEVIDNKLYRVKFLLADIVVSTPEELQGAFDPTAPNTNYVALANDIDLEGFLYVGPTGLMTGVVDGRGYAIKNFFWRRASATTGWTASNTLFGALENGGTIKNMSIVDFWDQDHWSSSIAILRNAGGIVENVYARPRPGINAFNIFGLYSNPKATWKNVILDYQPIEQEYNFLSGANASQDKYNAEVKYRAGKTSIEVGSQQGLCGSLNGNTEGVYVVSPYFAGLYLANKYNAVDTSAIEYEIYFAENDNEMPYLDTIKNSDGTYTHTRFAYPSDMVTVLNNYNANLEAGQEPYEFDAENLTVDDFIMYSEVDGREKTIAKRSNGFKRYNTFADLASASETLTSFEQSNYWSVVNGIPYWHAEVSNGAVASVGGVDVVGASVANVGRGQTAEVVVSYNGIQATINSIKVANEDYATVSETTLTGVANGKTSITINYTWGGKVYEKVVAIETVNPIYEITDLVIYNADAKSFDYDFDGEIVSGYLVTADGNVNAVVDENGFAVTFNPATNVSNVVTMFVCLENKTYKLTNVEYWDYVVSNASEYAKAMSYTSADGIYKKYITLANNIDMLITSDLTATLEGYADDETIKVAGVGAIKQGIYQVVNQNAADSHQNVLPIWWGYTNKVGFAGVLDGKGYAVSNYATFKYAKKGTSKVAGNYGIFNQFYVDDNISPVVKNIAYDGVVTNTGELLAKYVYANDNGSSKYAGKVTFENVYVRQAANGYFNDAQYVDGILTLKSVNAYGPNTLFETFNSNYVLKNFVFEHLASKDFNNGANSVHGSLFRFAGAKNTYDVEFIDKGTENVLFITKGMLHSSVLAAYDTAAELATVVKNSGKLEFARTYEKGFFVYGANETVGQQPYFQGFVEGTTLDNITADSIIWSADDISELVAGDKTSIANGVYKLKNVSRYENQAKLAADEGAANLLAKFTASCWKVENGTIAWASLA